MRRALRLRFLLAVAFVLIAAPFLIARNAPDFSLPAPDGKLVTLSAFRGKLVVIEFLQPT